MRARVLHVRLAGLLVCLLLGGSWLEPAHASRPLNEFKHISWSLEGGAPGRVNAITQSADGYLWIGGVEGLVRFDGVTFELIVPQIPAPARAVVSALLAAPDGDVWVGHARGMGVFVYRNGRLQDAGMPNPSREVNDLAIDRDGAVWVARGGRSRDTLARYANGQWLEIGADWGLPEQQVWDILFARDGDMWVALGNTVVMRRHGEQRFTATDIRTSPRAGLAQDAEGSVWLSDAYGTRIVSDSSGAAHVAMKDHPPVDATGGARIVFDSDGGLWGTTYNSGLFRIADPEASYPGIEVFTTPDGLTSDQTRALFEDQEGNIWIGTELGLDMFRPANVIVEPGIGASSPTSYRIAVTSRGVVYVSDASRLYAIEPGGAPRVVLKIASPSEALCAGHDGSVWMPVADRIFHVRDGVVRSIDKPAGVTAFGCAEDAQRRLWIPGLDKGLFMWGEGKWTRASPAYDAGGVPANVVIDPEGRPTVLFRAAAPQDLAADIVPLHQGMLDIGGLEGVLPGARAIYVSGAAGMARLAGGRVDTVPAAGNPWIASVNGLAQTEAGDTWMIGDAGIVRVRTDAFEAAFDKPEEILQHQIFDFRDGLNSFVQKGPGAQAVVGGDGRIWFLTRRNVVYVDPARSVSNRLPPPVRIQSVGEHGREAFPSAGVSMPPGTTSLAIKYTALSLASPNRVRFKYQLDGVDEDWTDAGGGRAAYYTNLGPGDYRFRVIAMNNDGVWNTAGDTVLIRIPPTIFQEWWFRGLLLLLAAALIWLAVAWRVRSATIAVERRLSERQAERVRIARELHDTLLQGFQGLLVRFQVVSNAIADDAPAKAQMEAVLDRADEILAEGRERVRDLRSDEEASSPIVQQIQKFAYELEQSGSPPIEVTSAGAPESLNLDAHREIFAIAREALTNAANHARAMSITCDVRFTPQRVILTCTDDGVGIDPALLRAGGRENHWGLAGMRERARQLGGMLRVESSPAGTKVRLSVPARIVRVRRKSRRL